ncbi:MAG: hypothetical protein P1V35_15300, partial [Planctomycetota bacterium]|nr:hypothetical protein [Planctomycetota bacterium]
EAGSALFVHQAGQASYGRHTSMATAAQRIPKIFDSKRAAKAEYLTNPDVGMTNMSDPDGRSRVTLKFLLETKTADGFLPKALEFIENYEAEYIYEADSLRQLLTDDTLTDITPLPSGEEGYTIRSYRRTDQVGAFVAGLHTILPGEVPYLESKVYNATPGLYLDGDIHVQVTERFAPGSEVVKIYKWNIDEFTNSTTFEELHPDPTTQDPVEYHPWKRTVLFRANVDASNYNQTRSKYEAVTPLPGATGAPTLELVSREFEKFILVDGEDRLVQHKTVVDAQGFDLPETVTTNYVYYSNSNNALIDGRPNRVESSDGMWAKYTYDLDDAVSGVRIYRTYTPFMDSPITDLANARLETVTTDGDTYTRIVSIAGQQVSKEVRTTSTYGNKLIIKKERILGTAAPLTSYVAFNKNATGAIQTNRIHSKVNEDGSVVLYTYTDQGNRSYSEVVSSGAGTYETHGLVTSVTSGTETTTLYNSQGKVYQVKNADIVTGLDLDSWSAIEPGTTTMHVDLFGRPTKKFFNSNASDVEIWDLLCCGIEENVSRYGVVTSFERDPLKRVTQRTVLRSNTGFPVQTNTTYKGLTTTVERIAGPFTLLESETTRSLGGLTTTTWSPDADGQIGLYTPPNTDYPKAERTERAVT